MLKEYRMNLKDNQYKPISFWSWNGEMREDEIRWQIREFKDKGFGGFFIHSRAGRLIPYMEEEWFQACAVAINEAEKVNLDVWLYDEDGWPSGFAGGRVNGCGEEYCGKSLCFSIGKPDDSNARILATYREGEQGDYYRIDLKESISTDLYAYYCILPHYVDIMDKRIVAKFIEVTHEEYKKHFCEHFGKRIKGIFTDEPQMSHSPTWSFCMEKKYNEKFQEDILDKLWLMHVNGVGYKAFRYRFWLCANELIKENYVGQINRWCNENHLIFTGHFSQEDGLVYQTRTNGGVMSLYANMGMPGIDHLGNRYASPILMKQVASVAHQKGIPYVMSESYGCAGWDVSFKELLGIVGWQAVLGVNTICTHLSAHSIIGRRKRDWPAFYSYQEPWWEDTKVLFEAIRKLNSEISRGERDTKVAVLHPIRSVWCESNREQSLKMRFLTAQFRVLVENLLDIQLDFDLLDESESETAVVEKGGLCIGNIKYTHLILPECTTVSESTAKMIENFTNAGGNILFINGRPNSIEGVENHPMIKTIHTLDAPELQNTRRILQQYFRANPTQDDWRLLDTRLENDISGLVSRYGKTSKGAILYVFNPKEGHQIRTILKHKGKCKIELMSLVNNQVTDVTDSYMNDATYAPITVESGTGVLVHITYVEQVQPICNNRLVRTELLEVNNVKPLHANALTLDMARWKINGGSYSSRKAMVHMLNEIYSSIAECRQDSEVCIEYTFEANFENMPEQISLAVEKAPQLSISLNGQLVHKEVSWWIDKGIMKYDISGLVVNGTNTVVLTYFIPNMGQVGLTDEFETEQNRFFYQVEPESIYVCGSFDVQNEQSAFTLVDATKKEEGDLTTQGMWFYRGNCAFAGKFQYDGQLDVSLRLDSIDCTCAKVYVNDSLAGTIIEHQTEVDITSYLQEGENEITVVAVGHNRNIMGPHHHKHGKLYFVGPHSFEGVWGIADIWSPDLPQGKSTWTEEYSFVPFGIGTIFIEHKRKK